MGSAPPPISFNVATHLPERARTTPHALAVACPQGRAANGRVRYTHLTFRQLDNESDSFAQGLAAIGIGRGVRTVLMVQPSLEFFSLTFALFKLGAVPVLVDPGMGIRNLGACLRDAEPEAFIGIPKAHVARIALGWARATLRTLVTVGWRGPWGGHVLSNLPSAGRACPIVRPDADETAAILFTSGSTGPPKGAVYTHGMFTAQVEALRQLYGIEPGEVDLTTFPLFALFAPALGMSAVIPDMDATRPAAAEPKKLIEAIEDFGATNMFGSPALLNRLGRYGEKHGVRLPSLRRTISAGAPVSSKILDRFTKMLPAEAQVFTPYGATEALPVSSIGSREILEETAAKSALGAGTCVGRPASGMTVRIVRISDDAYDRWTEDLALAPGLIGEIVASGSVVSRAYYNRPEATRLAKIPGATRGEFYHRMGDLGYFDEKGRLWFCGRKSHRVTNGREAWYTIPCEGVFNAHASVYRSALIGLGAPGSQRPALCVERDPDGPRKSDAELLRELLTLGRAHAHTQPIREILFHPAFPVDIRHNAKIHREKLAQWAARKLR